MNAVKTEEISQGIAGVSFCRVQKLPHLQSAWHGSVHQAGGSKLAAIIVGLLQEGQALIRAFQFSFLCKQIRLK